MVLMMPTTTPLDAALPSLMGIDPSAFIAIEKIAPVALLIVFGIWVLFTAIAAYHWFRYAHRSWVAVPAIAVHIGVSGMILLYALSGLG
jgi:hypothetical protein